MKHNILNYKNNLSTGIKRLIFCFIFTIFITGSFLSIPSHSQAAPPDDGSRAGQETNREINGFIPLVGIPYVDTQSSDLSLAGYVNALYTAAISIAAFMAVVKIIFAGVKYMLSDVVTDKGAAKKDIRGALIGLLIVIGAVLILNTINPQLKGLGALEGMTGVDIETGTHGLDCSTQPIPAACCAAGETYFSLMDDTALCAPSMNDADDQILDTLEEAAVGDGEFTSVVEVEGFDMTTFDNTPIIDRPDYLDEWAEECEAGTENEFTQVGGAVTGVIRYLCVTP